MTKRYLITPLLCMATLIAVAQKRITILHTNDTHSCVMPLSENLADTAVAGRGGCLRRIEMLKEERKKHPDLLYFDSGDFSQGSPYYSLFKGEVEVELMNRMGCDATTIGNHEFDSGLENLAKIVRKAKFPFLCANYDFTGSPLEGLVKPYVIIKRNGIKIGVFGIDTQLEGLVEEKNYGTLKYLDPVKTALEVATLLKERKKCDVVICLSHLGWNIGGDDDKRLMSRTRYIDLVLGGHSHSNLKQLQYVKNLDGKDIPNNQNGKNAIYVAKITLDFQKK